MERRTILVIFALAVLALASQILVWVFRPRDTGNDFVGPPRSDYTLTNFTLDALDESGQHTFSIVAPRLARKGDDQSIYVDQPKYEILDNSRNVWHGTSDAAWVNKDGTIMRMDGAVEMHREPTATVPPVRLLTSDLTITTDPKKKDARPNEVREKHLSTAALTTITDPDRTAHGVGMKADLTFKIVELLSDVHWISLPPEHAQH
ncbi:MAG TPA: LPS export ABC transporter periplasmic protein LptC [Rudaea sp.]